MSREQEQPVPAVIEGLAGKFRAWRAQRRRGERIPEALWREAVRVARRHGVYRVSQALRLDHAHLKRRVEEAGSPKPTRRDWAGEFVELTMPGKEEAAGCVVDLQKGNGTRMRICVSDAAAVDWSRVKEAFLGA
jgi:hypothetical protein